MGVTMSNLFYQAVKQARDSDTVKGAQQKKLKMSSRELQLVDINNDCFQVIFGGLILEDLMNMSEAHEQFTSAARLVFSRRYRKKKISIMCGFIKIGDCIGVQKGEVAKFFRHFGPAISSLTINYYCDVEVQQWLFDHCSDSLVELEMSLCNTNLLSEINKSFGKVEKLTIIETWLNDRLAQVDVWFPIWIT